MELLRSIGLLVALVAGGVGSVRADAARAAGAGNLLIAAVAWKQTAAEYRALYHQGFNIARMHVESALK